MNPGKWKVNLNHHIFMLYKSVETCPPGFITMQGHKYSHICNLWGQFLPVGMICTTIDTIYIPMGEMHLHVRMFCTLALHDFYSYGCNVRAWNLFWARVAKPILWKMMILLPCTLAHTRSIQNFYMQDIFYASWYNRNNFYRANRSLALC